jgi:uncharacterized membrane protein
MSNKTPEDILDLARQRIELRKQQEHDLREQVEQERAARERPWQYIFLSVLGALLLALFLAPGASLEWKLYAIVHGLVAQQHNVFLDGRQLPICARNIGIYSGFLITLAYLWVGGRRYAGRLPAKSLMALLGAFVLIMAVDGFNSLFGTIGQPQLYLSRNDLRTVTGAGMGITMAAAFLFVFNRSLRQNVDKRQPVMGWRDLGVVLALNGLMTLAVYSGLGLLYWPLAFLSFFGLVGQLFVINVLIVSLLMGYGNSITSMRELARPATFALLTNLLIIGALALLRFASEGILTLASLPSPLC